MRDLKQLLHEGNYVTAQTNAQENLTKLGYVYYDEFGWIMETRMQEVMNKGLIRHSEYFDEFVLQADTDQQGKAVMRGGFSPSVILGYLQGRCRLEKNQYTNPSKVQRTVDEIINAKNI